MEREKLQDSAEFVQGYLETVGILTRMLSGYTCRWLRDPKVANPLTQRVGEEMDVLLSATREYVADMQRDWSRSRLSRMTVLGMWV